MGNRIREEFKAKSTSGAVRDYEAEAAVALAALSSASAILVSSMQLNSPEITKRCIAETRAAEDRFQATISAWLEYLNQRCQAESASPTF